MLCLPHVLGSQANFSLKAACGKSAICSRLSLKAETAMDQCIRYEPYQEHLMPKTREDEEEDKRIYAEYTSFISTLPKNQDWVIPLYQYQGFWFPDFHLTGVLSAGDHFVSLPTDILLASSPKSGTTWLKSLAFAIAGRKSCPSTDPHHPLLTNSPHDLVLHLEYHLHGCDRIRKLDEHFPQPRLLATHIPYTLLPQSVIDSGCKIVYVSRNSKDHFVSFWHFWNRRFSYVTPTKVEKALEMFLKEVSMFGPYWDHVLGYWKETKKRPDKVLFLKYEEMQEEPNVELKKLASFMGFPFSEDEEKDGVVEDIIKLCSFDSLSNVDVNKTGTGPLGFNQTACFRKGKVGDSKNYLTEEMIKRLHETDEHKFAGSGLTF